MNEWISLSIPYVFIIDFEVKNFKLWKLSEINSSELLFEFNGVSNEKSNSKSGANHKIVSMPGKLSDYQRKFDRVMSGLSYGDSFLTNLTVRTPILLPVDLRQLFYVCHAPYKMWLKDSFLFFSPESFIKIRGNTISSYPMKGTIDATTPDAERRILEDQKEKAEHVTIVDLIRNDLSMVATDVHVSRFRYTDHLQTNGKDLLQVSSEIRGTLTPESRNDIGGTLLQLLPAGSISGAPKKRTVELIAEAEGEERGYYTGVCGYFNGKDLDTGVMIRYIEQQGDKYFYRSGGGITTQSNSQSEYQEVLDKIYVPIN